MTPLPLNPPAALEAQALAAAQEQYVWDWSWPPGCATLSALPKDQEYKPDFVGHIIKLSLEIAANHAALTIDGATAPAVPPIPRSPEDLRQSLFAVAESFHLGAPRTRPATPDGYTGYFATIQQPAIVQRERSDPRSTDALFGWQRVAGANPMSIARWSKLPDDFRLSEAQWTAAMGAGSLAQTIAEGRLFGLDFTPLHGAPTTKYLGRQKYLCGVRGAFAAIDRRLRPVAVQLEPGAPIVTPADGTRWAVARYALQTADVNVHETMEHLGRTHMVMEAVGVAARRQLLDSHPLRLLLDPHLVGTFAINNSAKTSLIAPNGVIDHVFAPRIDVAASFVRKALDTFVLQDRAPEKELKSRGVDDATVLEYPYRDDVLPVYRATLRFVENYVGLYYRSNADVVADTALKAWVVEVGSNIGGALPGIRPVETVNGLVEWMTNIIHIGSSQHAAVNFPQFPFFSWAPNYAGACWAPPAAAKTDADLLAMMPPWDVTFLQADTVYELAGVYYTRLGDYMFPDPRTAPIVQQFKAELRAVEQGTKDADAGRLIPYPFLYPSVIPASINI